MSRSLFVANAASVSREPRLSVQSKTVKSVEVGNVKPIQRSPSAKIQPLSKGTQFDSQSEQSARIGELETQIQNLWQHYATTRKQNLELMEENVNLQSEICRLSKSLAYETRLREVADAKSDI